MSLQSFQFPDPSKGLKYRRNTVAKVENDSLYQVYLLAQDVVYTKWYLSTMVQNKLSPPSCGAIFDPVSQSHLNWSSMHHADYSQDASNQISLSIGCLRGPQLNHVRLFIVAPS